MRRAFLLTTAFILLICAAAASNTSSQNKPTTNDVKIRQRMSSGGGQGVETVLYIKGQRMRNEMASSGMGFTTILQCDLKRTLTINERTKTYMVSSTDSTTPGTAGDGGPSVPSTQPAPADAPKRGGVVNVTNTITDTGERKQLFGFTARRIKTSMEKKASPDACDKDQKIETDGWYIDFQYAFTCPGESQKHQTTPVPTRPDCKDEVRTRTIGTAKLGFPLHVTTTVYQADGRTTTMTQEVLELSREQLSASLFEVPEGYALAKDMQALYGMGAATSSVTNTQPENNATAKANTAGDTTTTAASTAKKPGMIRIGLVMPKVQVHTGDAARTAEAVRNDFAKSLTAPNVEVVTLAARVPSAALDEARQSQCDYVLNVSMNLKKGGGGSMFGRAIGNVAGAAAGHIPGGGTAASGAARSAAITGVYTTAVVVGSIKAKDELSLEYKLDRVENASTVVTNTAKAKAKSDGEDILTPQIEAAAQAILNAVRR
ncbi:MAG TPA: hypothetical protein VFR78_22645 [Pyrinomonadaceae bacterium]|nr:hypothetical protein [Pyrinomonadaceae bacterium]